MSAKKKKKKPSQGLDLKPEDVVIPETPTKQSGAPQREPRAHKSQEIGFLHFIPDMGDYLSTLKGIDLDKNDLRLCFIESPLTNQENAINAFYLYVVYKFIHKHLVISSTTTMAVPSSPGTTSAAPPPPTTTSTTSTSTSTTTPTVPLFHFQCNQGANRSVNVAFIMNILFSNGTDFFDVLQKLSRSSTIQQGMWRTLIPNLVCLSFLFFSSQNKTNRSSLQTPQNFLTLARKSSSSLTKLQPFRQKMEPFMKDFQPFRQKMQPSRQKMQPSRQKMQPFVKDLQLWRENSNEMRFNTFYSQKINNEDLNQTSTKSNKRSI